MKCPDVSALSLFAVLGAVTIACSSEDGVQDPQGSGGQNPTGGNEGTGVGGTSSGGIASGGSFSSGGAASGGQPTGGSEANASGGMDTAGSGGEPGSGGAAAGGGGPGAGSGGDGAGGEPMASGGVGAGGMTGAGGAFMGTCTSPTPYNGNAPRSGTGPFDVIVETVAEAQIDQGTIFRPADLTGDEAFPIVVWGQGGCERNGLYHGGAMAEIASHGYIVVSDGRPGGGGNQASIPLGGGGDVLLGYVDWLTEENEKPCSTYYQKIDTSKVAANGFSCGGLMAAGTASDPRMTTWGHTSSGSFNDDPQLWDAVSTPVLIITGSADSLGAAANGQRDFDGLASRDDPVMMFTKVGADHGGDLASANGGEFTAVHLGWLNWWLKGDESASGKGKLVGAQCPYCSDNTWQIQAANLP